MSTDYRRGPVESPESRLHREFSWSRYDGAITANDVVYREQALPDGRTGYKLFREPHHTDQQMRDASDELLRKKPDAGVTVAEIYTVEAWGAMPAPSM